MSLSNPRTMDASADRPLIGAIIKARCCALNLKTPKILKHFKTCRSSARGVLDVVLTDRYLEP